MRRLALFCLAILTIVAVPNAAQEITIVTIVDEMDELSTLSAFLEAVPDIRDTLANEGSYTLFAPNNQAFANLSSSLNMSFTSILNNPEIITVILNYHILNGDYSAQELIDSTEQVLPTRLPSAFISIREDDDETVLINNVVEIVEADIAVSNGRLHIIDNVLLNRVIDNLVEELNLSRFITPNVTIAPTIIASMTPTSTPQANTNATESATDEAQTEQIYLRIANFASDVELVDVYVDDELFLSQVAFSQVSDFVALAQNQHTIEFVDIENDDNRYVTDFDLYDDNFATLVLLGSVNNDSLDTVQLSQNFTELNADESRVVLFNALENSDSLDIAFDDAYLRHVDYAVDRLSDVESGEYTVTVTAGDDSETLIAELDKIRFGAASFFFFAIVGTVDAPQFVIVETEANALIDLQSNQYTLEPEATAEFVEQTILDIVQTNSNFSILSTAIDHVDEQISIILNDETVSQTLLAPNNVAFENLLSTIAYTQDELLAETELLTDILRYHMVNEAFSMTDFAAADGTSILTRLRPSQAFFVRLTVDGNIVLNRDVQFLERDIQARNGIMHEIDNVLLPQSALDALDL